MRLRMIKVYVLHGAGAGHSGDFLNVFDQQLTQCLAVFGEVKVIPFTLDYMAEMDLGGKRRPPPNINKLIEEARDKIPKQEPIILIGKSMGSRIIAELCTTHQVKACVALGYPFYPPKKPEKDRLYHLKQSKNVPFHIIQGTRDGLGNRDWVEQQQLLPNINLHWFEGADHDFKLLKRYNMSQEEVMETLVKQTVSCIQSSI